MPSNLLRLPEVLMHVGLSRSNVYALIKRGAFPQPCKIGSVSAWPDDEIDAWIKRYRAKRDCERPI